MTITGSDRKKLKAFYLNLFKIRAVENKIIKEYPNAQMRCPVHLSIGQEGIATAVAFATSKKDYFISNHRGHAHYLAKNGSVLRMFAELLGKKSGCSSGNGGSMHLVDKSKKFIGTTAIVSSSIPVGVGYAEALKLKKKNSRVIIFLGDAATEEGIFYECVNYVSLKNFPVTFIVENNEFSVYTHLVKRQPRKRDLCKFTKFMGLETFDLLDTNPFILYKKIDKIFKNSKSANLIKIPTTRYYEHCGTNNDDNLNYRSKSFLEKWENKDPVKIISKIILKNNILSFDQLKNNEKKIINNIDKDYLNALKQKFPNKLPS